MSKGDRGRESFTELKGAPIFLQVLARICAVRLCEEKNGKVLHVARTKEEENTKHVGFAQEETIRPEGSGQ